MEMSAGPTTNPKMSVNCSRVQGKAPFVSDAPVSISSRLVNGALHDAWYRPASAKSQHECDSGAVNAPRPLTWYDWMSANAFTLFLGDTCHVTRAAWLLSHSFRNDGRSRSGV